MRKLAFTGIILLPSIASFITLLSTCLVVFVNTIFNIGGTNDQLFRLLLGSDSSPELFDSTKSIVGGFNQAIFGNSIVNMILFFSFWFLVGLVVYVFISGAGSGIDSTQKLIGGLSLLHVHKEKLEQEFALRLILRAAALSAWVIYSVVFAKLFFPFAVLSFQIAAGNDFQLINLATGLFGFAVLFVSLHLHVVFLRIFLLKPRVIGGWDDVLAARLT